MPHRLPFNSKLPLVAAREFIFAGETFRKGDPFPVKDFSLRLIQRQYDARAIDHAEAEEAPVELVQMTGPKGGRYTITAPWLADPEIVRGKANAEARLAELIEAGAPEGWVDPNAPTDAPVVGVIESEVNSPEVLVTVDGDKHTVTAPWLDAPEDFADEAGAVARQTELREAGPPEGWKPEAPTE